MSDFSLQFFYEQGFSRFDHGTSGDAFYANFQDTIDGRTYVSSNAIDGQEANIVSGATYSAQAGCNAINCVVKYVQENLRGAK